MPQGKKQSSKIAHTPRESRRKARQQRQSMVWAIGTFVVVIALAVVILLVTRNKSSVTPLPLEITAQEAYQKYEQGVFLLDVRTAEEYNASHIENTTLIPLDELPNRLSELPRDRQIVTVCRSGNRSQEGRDILLNAGFEQVTSMAGGVRAWYDAGYSLTGPRP